MTLYRVLLTFAWPVLALVLGLRVLRGSETWRDWRERLGFTATRRPIPARPGPEPGPHPLHTNRPGPEPGPHPIQTTTPDPLWIHGASNGELTSARAVIVALRARHPVLPFLITCNSLTARDMLRGWALPLTEARLAPLDTRWAAPRARAHLALESELWPNRLTTGPAAILGARLSERTARGWTRLPGLAGAVFPALRLVIPQDAASAGRFATLGTPPGRIAAPLQLKAAYTPPDRPLPPDIATAFRRDLTWLAASTHEGEDEIALAAHVAARAARAGLRLILAPRHPARGDAIAALIGATGLDLHRRSTGGAIPPGTEVLLADTMGEMDLWYRSAHATFVGGTLTDRGGHTPYEPAACGSAILHGPHVRNFADAYGALGQGGALPVDGADALARALVALGDPAHAARLAAAARGALAATGDLDTTLDRIDAALSL